MPSRNVAIQKGIYDALDRERRPAESFTKLFARLLAERGSLDELNGAWSGGSSSEDHHRLSALRGARRRS